MFEEDMTNSADQANESADQSSQQTATDLTSVLQKRVDDSQSFIETLKKEKQELADKLSSLEADVQGSQNVDKLLDEVRSHKEHLQKVETMEIPDSKSITDNVLKTLTERENVGIVQEALKSKFGSEYNTVAIDKAKSLGMTVDQLNSLSKTSPQAVVNMLSGTTGTPGVTASSQAAESYDSDKVYSELMTLRKTNPREFNKAHNQQALRKAILARSQR